MISNSPTSSRSPPHQMTSCLNKALQLSDSQDVEWLQPGVQTSRQKVARQPGENMAVGNDAAIWPRHSKGQAARWPGSRVARLPGGLAVRRGSKGLVARQRSRGPTGSRPQAVRQRGNEAACQRGSEAARRRGSEAARRRGSCAGRGGRGHRRLCS